MQNLIGVCIFKIIIQLNLTDFETSFAINTPTQL